MKLKKIEPDAIRRKARELMATPEPAAIDLESAVSLLHRRAEIKSSEGRPLLLLNEGSHRPETVKTCLARRAELPEGEEVNPLDDDEKLRQVRIAVFGSAPE